MGYQGPTHTNNLTTVSRKCDVDSKSSANTSSAGCARRGSNGGANHDLGHNVGARSTAAHAAWHVPYAALQLIIAAGAAAAKTVPNVKPAAV
jgi:hypothetical protein